MSEKVAAFPGVTRTDTASGAQPQPNVVQFLSELLEEAKRGDLQGIAVAMVRVDHHTSIGAAVGPRVDHDMAAAIGDLFFAHHQRRDAGSTVTNQGDPI